MGEGCVNLKVNLRPLCAATMLGASLFLPLGKCEGKKTDDYKNIKEKKICGIEYVTEFTDFNSNRCIVTYSNDEARKYLEVKNPTFDDVRDVVEKNDNLPPKFKKAIFDYISSLQKNQPGIDLCIFYYNMEGLKLVIDNENSEQNSNNVKIVAYFNSWERTIYLCDNFDFEDENSIWTLFHELTHALDNAFIQTDGCFVYRVNYLFIAKGGKIEFLGLAIMEGATENNVFDISESPYVAYDKDGEARVWVSSYCEYADIFSLLSSCANQSEFDFHEKGLVGLLSNLKENGVDCAIEIIEAMDADGNSMSNSGLREMVYENVFEDKCNFWQSNNMTAAEIENAIDYTFDNCFFEERLEENDYIISTYYGNAQQNLKASLSQKISELIEEPVNIAGDEPSGSHISMEDTFIYESKKHTIMACYKVYVDGVAIYTDGINYISEEDMVCGEVLDVLIDKGVVEFDGNATITIDAKRWKEYFAHQKTFEFTPIGN